MFMASGVTGSVHCFACWSTPEVILFSRSFHLLLDPVYRVSPASHIKSCLRRYLVPATPSIFNGTRETFTDKNRHMPVWRRLWFRGRNSIGAVKCFALALSLLFIVCALSSPVDICCQTIGNAIRCMDGTWSGSNTVNFYLDNEYLLLMS